MGTLINKPNNSDFCMLVVRICPLWRNKTDSAVSPISTSFHQASIAQIGEALLYNHCLRNASKHTHTHTERKELGKKASN